MVLSAFHPRFLNRNSILIVPSLLALSMPPALADFNDLVQVICDEDLPTAGSCDATADGMSYVSSVAVSADGKHVYFCSSQADQAGEEPLQAETLSAFSRAAGDGSLTLVDQEIEGSGGVTTLDSCRGAAVSPDGKHVYTAALSDNAVTWFSRDSVTGALGFAPGDALIGAHGSSLHGANAVAVSPDDMHVYVAGRSGDAIAAFSRDTTTGDLTSIADYFDNLGGIDGLDAPEDIAVTPDGMHVYVASQVDDAVAVFARDANAASPTFGHLTFVEAKIDGVGSVDGLDEAVNIALDASGKNVYVATESESGAGDWFAVFSRSPATGALTFLQSFETNDFTVNNNCWGLAPADAGIAVSPNELFVSVAFPWNAAIATFSRAADGTLTFIESICDDFFDSGDDVGFAHDLAHSPDGKNLYVAGGPSETLSTIDSECDSANVDLVLSNELVSTVEIEDACRSIHASTFYSIAAGGDVSMTAPKVIFGNGVSVAGTLAVSSSIP